MSSATALRDWDVPSQNFVYADVDGNIGYQMPGGSPSGRSGDGLLPVPGWTDEYEWTGYIPFDELPRAYNPPAGFIATANNAVVGADYPYSDLPRMRPRLPRRSHRVDDRSQAQAGRRKTSLPSTATTYNAAGAGPGPRPARPRLHAPTSRPDLKATVRPVSNGWDGQNRLDSAPAAVFNAIWRHLILRTFADELPEDWLPGDDTAVLLVSRLARRAGERLVG